MFRQDRNNAIPPGFMLTLPVRAELISTLIM